MAVVIGSVAPHYADTFLHTAKRDAEQSTRFLGADDFPFFLASMTSWCMWVREKFGQTCLVLMSPLPIPLSPSPLNMYGCKPRCGLLLLHIRLDPPGPFRHHPNVCKVSSTREREREREPPLFSLFWSDELKAFSIIYVSSSSFFWISSTRWLCPLDLECTVSNQNMQCYSYPSIFMEAPIIRGTTRDKLNNHEVLFYTKIL